MIPVVVGHPGRVRRSCWRGQDWGRYIYAIGASPEAARRAGINVTCIRTIVFALCSFTAGLAAVVYASRLGSISVGFDGGTYVLDAVAAAVIGGASLFGGYGKPIHPLLGGLVIATLTNGLALLNITTAGTDIATAVVLIVAVAVDANLRRRGRSGPGVDALGETAPSGYRPAQRSPSPKHSQRADRSADDHNNHSPRAPSRGPCTTATPRAAGLAPSVTSVDVASPAWTSPTLDGQLYGEPLVSGGEVFAATENDTVYALSAATGAVVWAAPHRHARAVEHAPLR